MTTRGEVAIFFTGGTITMTPRKDAPGVAPGGEFDRLIEELHLPDPSLRLRPVVWGDRPSPHMTPELMFQLAKDVDRALAQPHVLGAVVLHGTDLLVESSFMADLVIESPKPVVYTGGPCVFSASSVTTASAIFWAASRPASCLCRRSSGWCCS